MSPVRQEQWWNQHEIMELRFAVEVGLWRKDGGEAAVHVHGGVRSEDAYMGSFKVRKHIF